MATMDDKNDQATLESESALPGFEQPSNVSVTLPLLYGKMTLGEALDEEDNVLLPLSYSSQRQYFFFFWIYEHREDFKALVSLHLSLAKSETCRFGEFKEWKHGSFNVCIPIYIDNWRSIQGNGCFFGYRCPTKLESRHIPAMQTRNSAPKPLPSSGFKKTALMFQYRSYGGLDFQVVRVYKRPC